MIINHLACVKISIIGQLLFDILRYRVATPAGPVGAQKYHHLEIDGMHMIATISKYIFCYTKESFDDIAGWEDESHISVLAGGVVNSTTIGAQKLICKS